MFIVAKATNYCVQTLSVEQSLVNSVYSMMPVVQTISLLYKTETGKNGVENKQERWRERVREAD
jgi:hypothetical protein